LLHVVMPGTLDPIRCRSPERGAFGLQPGDRGSDQVVGLVIQSQNPRLHVFPEPHIPSHATSIDQRRYRLKAILVADALAVHGASESEGRVARVFSHKIGRASCRESADIAAGEASWRAGARTRPGWRARRPDSAQ